MYKEVQTYYAAGLNPPDDVTLIFPDDNAGNVQRLPTGNESERKGGIGVRPERISASKIKLIVLVVLSFRICRIANFLQVAEYYEFGT